MIREDLRLKRGHWLVRLSSGHFVAGVEIRDGVIVRAAPRVNYMLRHGWTTTRVVADARWRGWGVEFIRIQDPPPPDPEPPWDPRDVDELMASRRR